MSARIAIVPHMGNSGYNSSTTSAPANSPEAVSTTMERKMLTTEKYVRLRPSKRFSRNSGMV